MLSKQCNSRMYQSPSRPKRLHGVQKRLACFGCVGCLCWTAVPALAQTPWPTAPVKTAVQRAPSSGRVATLVPPPANPNAAVSTSIPPKMEAQGGQSGTLQYPVHKTAAAFPGVTASNRIPVGAKLPDFPSPSNLNPLPPSGLPAADKFVATNSTSAAEEFKDGQIICVVGEERILAGDMRVFIEEIIAKYRSRMSPAEEKELRLKLTREALVQYVEIKAMYQEFLRSMAGSSASKDLREAKQKIVVNANRLFFEKQVPSLRKKYDCHDLATLEQKLREKSVSLTMLKNQFIEQVMAHQLEKTHVREEYQIDRDDLLKYYQEHANDWQKPATARWRQLTARFDKHATREEAEMLAADLGNEVFLGGKPFAVVAKQRSEGFTAASGGVYDWTTRGSLKSAKLDQAIFSYPIGKLSPIIEDEIGYHIVEVLERKDEHSVSFEDAQVEIRKKLSDQKRQQESDKFRDEIMKRTTVWTMWPEDIPGSRSLIEALGVNAQ